MLPNKRRSPTAERPGLEVECESDPHDTRNLTVAEGRSVIANDGTFDIVSRLSGRLVKIKEAPNGRSGRSLSERLRGPAEEPPGIRNLTPLRLSRDPEIAAQDLVAAFDGAGRLARRWLAEVCHHVARAEGGGRRG